MPTSQLPLILLADIEALVPGEGDLLDRIRRLLIPPGLSIQEGGTSIPIQAHVEALGAGFHVVTIPEAFVTLIIDPHGRVRRAARLTVPRPLGGEC